MKILKYLLMFLPLQAMAHSGHDGLATLPGFVQDLLVPVVVVSAVLGLLIYRQRKTRKGND